MDNETSEEKPFKLEKEYYLYTFGEDMIDWQKLPTITTYIQDHVMNWDEQGPDLITLNESVLATRELMVRAKNIWAFSKGLIDGVKEDDFYAPRMLIIKAGTGYIWMSKDQKRGILASPRLAREGSVDHYIGHITFRKKVDNV